MRTDQDRASAAHDERSGIARLQTSLDGLDATLRTAEALLRAGRRIDLDGLPAQVAGLCDDVLALPPDAAAALQPKLRGVLARAPTGCTPRCWPPRRTECGIDMTVAALVTRLLSRRLGGWTSPAATAPLRLEQVLPIDPRRRLCVVRCGAARMLLLTGGPQDLALGWLPADDTPP